MLTWGHVVADREVWSDVATNIAKSTRRTVLSSTTNLGGVLPDNLGEVTPVLKVGHVWLRLAVEAIIPSDLTIVEELCNDSRDVVGRDTSSNVLPVPTTTCSDVVCIVAVSGDGRSGRGNTSVPHDVVSRVVGAVNVVVVHRDLRVGGGQSRRSGRGRGGGDRGG